jgi:hypothetical protein
MKMAMMMIITVTVVAIIIIIVIIIIIMLEKLLPLLSVDISVVLNNQSTLYTKI